MAPDSPSTGWGVDDPMGATWVRLQDRRTSTEFLFLNTHFEDGPDGAESRREASRLIVDRMKAIAGDRIPVVLTGDFTFNTDGEAHAIIRDAEPPLYPSDHYPVIADLQL